LADNPREVVECSKAVPATTTHVVLLIHGIRDQASWAEMLVDVLKRNDIEVIPIRYGYFDAFRFWCPFLTRRRPIRRVTDEVLRARKRYPDCRISVICHSFGTYIVGHILRNHPFISFHQLILCGSVLPTHYRWREVADKIGDPGSNRKPINECGSRDIWPILAQAMSWGYGASGTYGFGSVDVYDRYHNSDHSQYFEPEFVERYWRPLLWDNNVVESSWAKTRPATPWKVSILGLLPLRWLLSFIVIGLLVLGAYLAYRSLPGHPNGKDDEGVPVGRAIFLDIAHNQHKWEGLSAWAQAYVPKLNLLKAPFEPQSFSGEKPGVLIFPLPKDKMLDDQEVGAIRSWVERGGGLLVLGYYVANKHHESNVSRLTGEWGITFNDDLLMKPGASEEDARIQPLSHAESLGVSLEIRDSNHPILYNVKRVVLLSSASLDVSHALRNDFEIKTGTSSEARIPKGRLDPKNGQFFNIEKYVNNGQQDAVVVTASEHGKGKVAVIGTWKVLTLPYFADNQKLVENLIRWLRP
jgi:pimeloyl-ACP methyl ester carboxylesterase